MSTIPRTAEHADELTLSQRLCDGDEAAFEELVRDQAGRMLAVARRFLRSEDDARDAVQGAFCAAFRSIRSFRGHSTLSTWLHRIVVNECLMRLRSRSRRCEESLEGLLPTFDETGHSVTPFEKWPGGAEDALLSKERCVAVRAAIDRLPDSHRTVLLLRDIEDLDTPEVARILDLSPNAVKIRLHRARQALRTLLTPLFASDGSQAATLSA
ncbi:MAG TPA: sigma-70 family RNA polymerase sigma factor [Thermoanaerobaculia bacterium]|nr:sigma-70 family RNA polymerase sigma factor [Thermoanaerobaculia bacterium]